MNHHGSLGPLADCLSLLSRPPALIAVAVISAMQLARGYVMAMMIAQIRVAGAANLGLVVTAFGFAFFLLLLAIQFHLARRLGSDEPPTRPAELGTWFGAAMANGGAFWLMTAIVPVVMISMVGMTPYLALAMGIISLALRLLLYPVATLQAAAAHGDRELTLGKIWAFVTSERPVWYLNFLLLGVAASVTPLLLSSLPSRGLSFSITNALPPALIGAIIQVLLLLYDVATCRAARAAEVDMGSVFD
ncbi:MAG: hypothetical protein KGL44_03915 [Sphingomonadales bacterium]|nr:hypothetical protein [Sphingomonadales bacterium]